MRSKLFLLRSKGEKTVFIAISLAVLFLSGKVWGQENQIRFVSSGSVDWIQKEFSAQVSFDMAQAGIKLPAGRFMGEEILNEASQRLLRPYLLSFRVDSNSTIKTLVNAGQISLEDLDRICLNAEKTTSLSPDLSRMVGRYNIPLGSISSLLIRHRSALEPQRPLIPVETMDYTGIIIIASGELPVHGRKTGALAEPCLFPKIWDTSMNLIYERNMFEDSGSPMVRYTGYDSIFRATPSGLDGDLAVLAGANPLRIIARELFGIYPTDLIIDRQDALKILSGENNRRLLREGRVVIVLNNAKLQGNPQAF